MLTPESVEPYAETEQTRGVGRLRPILTTPIYERLMVTQPSVLAELLRRGLLAPGFALEERASVVELTARREIVEAMSHDAWRRVRGALRQARWAA